MPKLAAQSAVIRINAGGWSSDFTDVQGRAWVTDRHFTFGGIYYSPTVENGNWDAMLSTARYAIYNPSFTYRIPVANGAYQVNLHFIEHTLGPGARRFHVDQNGVTVLQDFDIRAEAPLRARVVKTLPATTVTGGILELVFRSGAGAAIVSGIEVFSASSTTPNLTVAPASLTFTAVAGGANPAAQNLSITNGGGGGAISWTASDDAAWLSVSPSSGSTPSSSVAVNVTTGALTPGTYNATITIAGSGQSRQIPVTLTVTAGPNLTVAPANLTFTAVAGGANPAAQNLSITNAGGGGAISWTASDDAAWLSVSPSAGSTPSSSVAVNVATGALTPGTYNATITVASSGQSRQIPVTFTVSAGPNLTVAPSSLTFTAIAGGANPASQNLSVTNEGGGGAVSWTASDDAAWLSVSPSSGSTPSSSVAVNVTSGALAPGTYNATITVAGSGQTRQIPVTLTVTGPVLTVSPTALTFTATAGGSNPAAQIFSVANTGDGGAISWTAVDDAAWLTVTPSSGSTPSPSVTVSAATGALTAGAYNATITVTGAGQTRQIAVTFVVEAGPNLTVAPATLTFTATVGGGNPASQNISITNSGGGGALAWMASDDAAWLTVTPSGGSTPATAVVVSVSTGSLAAGSYNATITVTAGAQSRQIAVSFTVTTGNPTALIRINAGGWSSDFTDVQGRTWVTDRYFTSGGIYYSPTFENGAWDAMLTTARYAAYSSNFVYRIPVANGAYQVNLHFIEHTLGPGARRFHVDQNGVTVLQDFDIRAEAGLLTRVVKTLPVVTVTGGILELVFRNAVGSAIVSGIEVFTAAAPTPNLTVSPGSLSFAATTGGANPASQSISITNAGGGGALSWTASDDATWLSVSPTSGSTPSPAVTVSAATGALPAGSHTATITITANGQSRTVAVTFNISDAPNLTVAPATLTFSATTGGANPASQSISITNAGGGGALSWTASDDATWLSVSPTSGSTPSPSVAVTAATGALPAGSYTAIITITGAGQTRTIPVSFTVSDTGNLTVLPNTLSFTGTAGGANPAAQTIAITNAAGGGAISWIATDDASWLNVAPASGVTPSSSVTVTASTGALSPGTYNATVTVTGAGQTRTIPVSFSVAEAPNLTLAPASLTFSATTGGGNPASQSISITNTGGGGALSWTASDDATWLTVSPTAGATPASAITVLATTGSLTAGTYIATITVTAAGQTRTIPVTFAVSDPPVLTVLPSTLTFSAAVGGGNPGSQNIAIMNTGGGGGITWTVSDDAPWLTVSPGSGATPSPSVAVTASTGTLTAGTYTATISVTGAGQTRTIAVTFYVLSGTQTAVIRINAGGWASDFTDVQGRTWLTDRHWTNGGIAYKPTFENGNWDAMLSTQRDSMFSPNFTYRIPVSNGSYQVNLHFIEYSRGPGERRFSVDQNGVRVLQDLDIRAEVPLDTRLVKTLPVVTVADGFLELVFRAGTGSATVSGIEVLTASSGSAPDLTVGPAFLTFAASLGTPDPAPQSIAVTNIGGGGPISWTASAGASWLTVSPSSGTTPASGISAQASLAGLAAGTHSTSITVSGAGQTRVIPVTFSVYPPHNLSTTPATISVSAFVNGPAPALQALSIVNLGVGPLPWTAVSDRPWLQVAHASGTTPFTTSVIVNHAGLAPGTYTGTITVNSPGAPGSPDVIAVTLTVEPQAGLTAQPSSLSFTNPAGAADPPASLVRILNLNGGLIFIPWTARTTASWVSISPSSGASNLLNTPSIIVRPLTAGLPVGTHNASVIIETSVSGVLGAPVTIPVSVTIQPAPAPGIIVKGTSVTTSTVFGGADPPPETLSVSNAGTGPLTWSATASQPWIVLSPPSGSAPSLMTVRTAIAGLAAGTHTGTVTFSSPGTANVVVPVSLTIYAFGASGRQFHVAVNGTPAGNGSQASPWDLATALAANGPVGPGDVVWVHNGVYRSPQGYFTAAAAGSSASPLIFRQYPGERATIEGGIYCFGPHTWLWGLEISGPPGANRSAAFESPLEARAEGVRFINLAVHDTSAGMSLWSSAVNAEAYGNIIYNNGFADGGTRGHGHSIYTQNDTGLKTIHDNILFNSYGFGLHAYSSTASFVRHYDVQRNISFNAGVLTPGRPHYDNIFFSSGNVIENVRVENNYTFHTPSDGLGLNRIATGGRNRNVVVRGNLWVGGEYPISIANFDDVDFRNNTTYTETGTHVLLTTDPAQTTAPYLFDSNLYQGIQRFSFNGSSYNFTNWKLLIGKDDASTYSPLRPSTTQAFVLPNKYERGRAHIVVYNWSGASSVAVDLSGVLAPGANYEVRNAQNFFGPVVLQGTYSGGSITLPMTGLTVAPVQGTNLHTPPPPTGPDFNVFVVLPR